ncbi:MAG: YicC/YloC family endoribonuclease, partial [Spirochaetota bacterium]
MTGYAQKSMESEDYTLHCEIKSLNNKYLEMKLKLPPYLLNLEYKLRKIMRSSIKRGKVEVFIEVEVKETLEFDFIKSLIKRYCKIAKAIEGETDLKVQISISELLSLRNLLGQHDEY